MSLPEDLLDSEYELQHYDFTVEELKDSFREFLDQKIGDVTNAILDTIIAQCPKSTTVADKLRASRDTLVQDLSRDCYAQLDGMDRLFHETFAVPPHVLLADETDQAPYNLSDEDFNELEIVCAKHKESCQTNKVLIANLKEEMNTYLDLKAKGVFDNVATTIETCDEALATPIEVDRLADALEKLKHIKKAED